MPAIPDLLEPLTDGQVSLRFACERDIPEILIAHQDDTDMHARLGAARQPSGAALGREAEHGPAERAAGTAVLLSIVERGSDECKGQVRAHEIDWVTRRAQLAIWVAPQARRRGVASRALRLATAWLLGSCGLERLDLHTEPDNEPLLGTARAAGFEQGEAPAVMSLGRGDPGR